MNEKKQEKLTEVFKSEEGVKEFLNELLPTKEQLEDGTFKEIFEKEKEIVEEQMRQGLVIGFVGTASSGKDSAIKALFGFDKGEISPVPGSTKDISVYELRKNIFIVNAPGFGDINKEVSAKAKEAIEKIDIFVYLVNAEGGVKAQEAEDFKELKETGKPVLVVLNKIDLIKNTTQLADIVDHTKESLNLNNDEDFLIASFHPHPALISHLKDMLKDFYSVKVNTAPLDEGKPLGVMETYDWLLKKLKEKGKDLLFAKMVKQKDIVCEKLIKSYAVKAFGIGAAPIPGSDIFALLPLQIKMGIEIAAIYEVNIDKHQLKQLIMNILSGNVMRKVYQGVITVLKAAGWLPGGQLEEVIVCGIAGTMAASGTYAIGKALQYYYKNNMNVSFPELQDIFEKSYNEYKEKNKKKLDA